MGMFPGLLRKRAADKRRAGNLAKFDPGRNPDDFIAYGGSADPITRRGKFPTSNNSGADRYSDEYFDYELVENRLVRGNPDSKVPRYMAQYEPVYKAVGRRPGVAAHNDQQPVNPKRTKDPRSSGSLKKAKGENRRASTILTGAKGLLGGANTTKTLLGK